jgi:hypothetical protein
MGVADLPAAAAASLRRRRIVASDPRKLKPGELVRLLNSAPTGPVTDARRLAAHRAEAGLRIGDGKTVDVLRYAAWLFERWQKAKIDRPSPDPASGALESPSPANRGPQSPAPARAAAGVTTLRVAAYGAKKERERERNAVASRSGRDIGPLPDPVDPARKKRALDSFRAFCEAYFPERFTLAWSPDHLKVIGKIEQAVVAGGVFALAMPRGSGKTSLVEVACLWAALKGSREFILLVGASAAHAMEMLDALKVELETNDRLLEDFPEVCLPIRRLEGLSNRAAGQLYLGERTHIGWTGRVIVLPTIAGSAASGIVIRLAGITGRIRGAKFVRPDGRSVRPQLVIIDDPQTDQSARSVTQCEARGRILGGAILGLAGPGEKIAGIMPCTVVRRGDLADEFLDRDKHPEWQGERTKLLYALPSDEKLWDEYSKLRGDSLRNGGNGSEATEFYGEHRAAMDAGAIAAWPERHNSDELSAVQNAMNLRIADPASFAAEYQNDPLEEDDNTNEGQLSADLLVKRTNGFLRGVAPLETRLTAFVDVQQKLLYWLVAAWRDDFSGFVVDYGAWPDPQRAYFTLRETKKTLSTEAPGASLEAAIYAGLHKLTGDLLSKEFPVEGGGSTRIEKCFVDAGWGKMADVVHQACRSSPHAAILMPSQGKGITAAQTPFAEWKKELGARIGFHWAQPSIRGKRTTRMILIDVNYWKTFVAGRLGAAPGTKGALTLFGKPNQDHRLLADHFSAEYSVRTEGRGRTLDEWQIKPDRRDNHWWDCLVGSACAASVLGCTFLASGEAAKPKKERIKLSDIKR